MRTKAIVFDKIGVPEQVLYLSEITLRETTEDEVLIKMVASSIIPGDFLFIQNMYPEPKKPHFPNQIGGNHGAGIITKAGKNVDMPVGTFVFFTYYSAWAEYAIVPKEWLIALPQDYPILKATQLVNMITAWDLISLSGAKSGDWIAQTAGYATVSLLAAQFAKRLGIKVISIIRRSQPDFDEPGLFADAVIDLSAGHSTLREQVMEITAGQGLNGVIDNVGGPDLEQLVKSLAFGAKVVINGNMSTQNFTLHNNDILFNGVEIRPHIYRYLLSPPAEEDGPLLKKILAISAETDFLVHIGGTHKLEAYTQALKATINHPEKGKQVFILS